MAVLGEYHASNDAPGPRVAAKSWHRGNASAVRANREQWGETSRFSEGLFPDRYGSCRTSAGAETCLWRWHDQSFPPLPKRLSKVCGTCSPFQAESVRRSSRSDVCSARSASLARYRSCRAERCERSDRVLSGVRSGIETSLRTWRDRSGFLVFREVSPRRRSSVAALVEATCIHSDVPPLDPLQRPDTPCRGAHLHRPRRIVALLPWRRSLRAQYVGDRKGRQVGEGSHRQVVTLGMADPFGVAPLL